MINKPIAEIGAWLGMIEPKRTAIHSVEKANPDKVIAEIKVHWEAWFNYFIPGLFESKSFRAAIATMPKEATSWDGNTACEAAWNLANTLVLVKSRIKHDEPAPPFGDYDVEMDSNQKYWKEQQKKLHEHLAKALELFESGQLTDEDLAANHIEQYRPNHALNVNALKEWVAVTRIISPLSLFSRCPNTMMLPRSIKINAKKGGFPLEARAKTAVIREVLHWVPLGTKNRFAAVSELLKLAGFTADRKQIKNVDSFVRFGKT